MFHTIHICLKFEYYLILWIRIDNSFKFKKLQEIIIIKNLSFKIKFLSIKIQFFIYNVKI